jgi:hypothetical protein
MNYCFFYFRLILFYIMACLAAPYQLNRENEHFLCKGIIFIFSVVT